MKLIEEILMIKTAQMLFGKPFSSIEQVPLPADPDDLLEFCINYHMLMKNRETPKTGSYFTMFAVCLAAAIALFALAMYFIYLLNVNC